MVLLESPWPILSVALSIEVLLMVALLITRRGQLLWWMLGAAGLALLGLAVEWLVVTDREAIHDAMYDGAAACEANDLDRLLSHIAPSAQNVRSDAQLLLGRVEVTMARILEMEIRIDRQASPRAAKVFLKAIGKGRDRRGEFPFEAYAGKIAVQLQRLDGRWLVVDYTPEELQLPKPGR